MEMQNVKDQAAKVFTPARLKKAVACAVLVGIVSAGGAYYHHRQAEARSLVQKQAQSEMIAVQASQRGMVLLDEEHVQTIAAEAIGKSVSELNFRTIYLTAKDHDDKDGKRGDKHRDGKHDRKHDRKEQRDGRPAHDRDGQPGMMPPAPQAVQPAPADGAVQPAPAAAPTAGPQQDPAQRPMMQPDFRPVYKVKCYAGNVEYKLRIDAVTGTVLSSKADVDDDIF